METITVHGIPPFTVDTNLAAPWKDAHASNPCHVTILGDQPVPSTQEGGEADAHMQTVAFGVGSQTWAPRRSFDRSSKSFQLAISNTAKSGAKAIALKRAQRVRKWTTRAFQLKSEEVALHERLPQHSKSIFKSKMFLVLAEILEEREILTAA